MKRAAVLYLTFHFRSKWISCMCAQTKKKKDPCFPRQHLKRMNAYNCSREKKPDVKLASFPRLGSVQREIHG